MRELSTVEELEAVVGTRPLAMMMKPVDALDDGCRRVLTSSPVAGFGYRSDGAARATMVGGPPGFVEVLSETRVRFEGPVGQPTPDPGTSVSLVFLLPGVGETLRFTGVVRGRDGATVTVDMTEAWVHCAKCIHRSGLWDRPADHGAGDDHVALPAGFDASTSAFGDPRAISVLARSPFAIVTSFDGSGASDCSPRGDRPGFIRVLDESTVAMPDRKGNRRTDTFHNLIDCDDLALCAVVPGRTEVLHLRGRAFVTDDAPLLAAMALNERPPQAALVLRVEDAQVLDNPGIAAGRMWDASAHVDPASVPDLMALGAEHLAKSKAKGAKAAATRVVSRGLAANPRFLRKGVDRGYRQELDEEGF